MVFNRRTDGWFLLVGSFLVFMLFLHWIVLSKILPEPEHPVYEAQKFHSMIN